MKSVHDFPNPGSASGAEILATVSHPQFKLAAFRDSKPKKTVKKLFLKDIAEFIPDNAPTAANEDDLSSQACTSSSFLCSILQVLPQSPPE